MVRNRIVGLREVPASSLVPHPDNWRRHPREQSVALQRMIDRIGFADAVLTRELEDGRLQLVDGHLRQDIAGEDPIPALVLDLDEEEAQLLLATLDPLAAMAETEPESLNRLIDRLKRDADEELGALLEDIRDQTEASLEQLAEQDSDAEQLPHDGGPPGTNPIDETITIHYPAAEYQQFIDDCEILANAWDLVTVNQVCREATKRAIAALPNEDNGG